jgi:predicted metal-dependent phosphoesterase TrpH
LAKADLHIHTTASDGKIPPDEVVRQAVRLNLSVIAITDHDTTAGIPAAQKEGAAYDLQVLAGVEITTLFGNHECHLLAYLFDMDDEPLNILLHMHQGARIRRARQIIEKLRKKGLELDIEEVLVEANTSPIGRPHIAEILYKKGYVRSVREEFIRYLNDKALGSVNADYCSFSEAVNIIQDAGGVAVLAHPGRMYSLKELEQLTDKGVDGIEVMHPSHNKELRVQMEKFASEHHLLVSGGSDFHGSVQHSYSHFGSLTISEKQVAEIKAFARRRKKIVA